MSEQENGPGETWRGMLTESDIERVERAFAVDPDLEQDLEAMLKGLSEHRRALLVQRFAANLPEADSPASALLPALADIMRSVLAETDAEAPGPGDTPHKKRPK